MVNSKNFFKIINIGYIWRICLAVVKEFWFPVSLAIGLAIGGVSSNDLHKYQANFFGFLMLAWFTGQVVRIKREIERKDSVNASIEKLSSLSSQLDQQLKVIVGHATGGDAYIKVYPMVDKVSGDINFGTIVEGNFPVRSVDIVMQNLETDEPWKTAVHDYEEIIWPGIVRSQATWVVSGQSPSRCLIQLSALNGTTFCETLVERSDSGEFVSAARQKTEKTPWEYSIHANFPNHDASRPDLLFKFDIPPMHRIGELSPDQ